VSQTPPIYRGPVRAPARGRRRPPRKRSSAGPLVFALVVVAAALALFFLARPLATDAIVQAADDHDTLLRQSAVRAIIAPRVEPLVDVPADPNAKTVDFTVRRGANASQIAADLQGAGLIKSALAFKFVLFEDGIENSMQTGTYKVSAALSPRVSHFADTSANLPSERTTPPSEPVMNCNGLPGTVTTACWSGWIVSARFGSPSCVRSLHVAPASVDSSQARPFDRPCSCP